MKNAIAILALGFFCGCSKPVAEPAIQKWEYKVVEVENYDHFVEDKAYTNHIDLDGIRDARNEPGEFHLDDAGNALGKYVRLAALK
jgi:hypothetical protein